MVYYGGASPSSVKVDHWEESPGDLVQYYTIFSTVVKYIRQLLEEIPRNRLYCNGSAKVLEQELSQYNLIVYKLYCVMCEPDGCPETNTTTIINIIRNQCNNQRIRK